MNILQFKRGQIINQNPTLKDGEIYIDNKNHYVRVGISTAPNGGLEGFNIKSKPVFGVDIVNQGGNVIPKAVQDFTITNGTGGNSVFNVTYVDGTTDSKPVTLSGSVASANYATSAGTASKLSTQKKGANTTNAVQPIWWNNYLPEALTASSGSASNPVYVASGVIKPITSINMPVYYTSNQQLYGKVLQVNSTTGQFEAANGGNPFARMTAISGTHQMSGAPVNLSSLGITQTGTYMIMADYKGWTDSGGVIHDSGTKRCVFWITITDVSYGISVSNATVIPYSTGVLFATLSLLKENGTLCCRYNTTERNAELVPLYSVYIYHLLWT